MKTWFHLWFLISSDLNAAGKQKKYFGKCHVCTCTNKINLDLFFFHTMFGYYVRTTGSEPREEIYRVIQHQMHIIYLCPALNIHIRAI